MQYIINGAAVFILIASLVLFIWKGGTRVKGLIPVSVLTFCSILFTTGLDSGLIMLPLTEFPTYKTGAEYQFTNPAAIEFGFWGFLVWLFYFITTYYFLKIEPVVQLFKHQWVNILNTCITIATCAFTAALFFNNLPTYIDGISPTQSYLLVLLVICVAIYTSSNLVYIKYLSVASTFLFTALLIGLWFDSGIWFSGLLHNLVLVGDYFPNIHRFILPISDYHAFYIMWWFSWSIMIGQFVARFASDMSVRTLMISMLVIPSILLALWYAILYGYFSSAVEVSQFWKLSMVTVGVIFVINSLDSLIRLYSDNLNMTVTRLGFLKYALFNLVLMFALVLFYLKAFKDIFDVMKYVGMVVIALYIIALGYMAMKWRELKAARDV